MQQFTFRPGRRRAGRGAGHPQHAPADRSATGPVAAEELHRHPDAGRRGHLPVPPGRAEQPGRRAAGRAGRGPGRHAAAGRGRARGGLPGRRAGAGGLPGEHPPGAGAADQPAAAGQQPGVPARLAADRGAAVRPGRVRAAQHAADAGHRAGRDQRAGPAAGGGRVAAGCGDAVHLPGRRRGARSRSPTRRPTRWRRWTSTPRRCSGPVPAAPPTRTRSCRC